MTLNLKQLFGMALSIQGETIPDLAKRWNCSRQAVHNVLNGTSTSKSLNLKIVEYVEDVLSANTALQSEEELCNGLCNATDTTLQAEESETCDKNERNQPGKLCNAKRGTK